jgi:hypothetical protein
VSLVESARVTVLVADYVSVDSAGKLTAVGAGFMLTALQPDGQSPPQHLAVLVEVPNAESGHDFALGVSLIDETTGQPVLVPGPSGEPEALRLAQVVQAQAPALQGMLVPSGVPGRVQLVLAFPQGLPLEVGHSYRWSVEVDGQTQPGWSAWFHVPSPAPGPVFGGPPGPATIPSIPPTNL